MPTLNGPLKWDDTGEKIFETGLDRGVLYPISNNGTYPLGVAWNGLSAVSESPSGAESNKNYANNQVYINLLSAEEFACTIEAYTYPEEFAKCDGTASPQKGVFVGQQARQGFGLSYRTKIGNDILGEDLGYKIHLVYGGLASPSEKSYQTIGDTPEAVSFSWEVSTTPVFVAANLRPAAKLTIDSTKVSPAALASLEALLYGTTEKPASLPMPSEVIELFADEVAG